MKLQDLIHWLEQGRGARWVVRAGLVLGAVLLTFWYSWRQFHGVPSEFVMQQAVAARQLAQGEGFTTLVNYPQTYAVLKARGIPFDDKKAYPELYHAPFYSIALAAGFKLLPATVWTSLPKLPAGGDTADGWGPDYAILAMNLALLWLGVVLVWRLARRLFDVRVAWVATLATVASVTLWQQTVALSGTSLLVVLVLAIFNGLAGLEQRWEDGHRSIGRLLVRTGLLGLGVGLVTLSEYSAGLVFLSTGGYLLWRFSGGLRWQAFGVFAGAFLLTVVPWLVRNEWISGHPLGLAWQNLALKAGDSTAEPYAQRNLATVEAPAFSLNKLGNKGLTGMELNLKERVWSGGAMILAAFFVAGLAYRFRHAPVNRVRWCFAVTLLVLLAGQPFLGSGESPRLPAYYLAPLIVVFGAGFLFVLIDSQPSLAQHWKWVASGVLVLQALPLVRDSMEPKRIHFHYPPYFPHFFMGLRDEIDRRHLPGTGWSADVPAGAAWYSRSRVWAKPERLRDLSQIIVDQNIGALLLTPVTLDRPFLTELAARKENAIRLSDTGGWGAVYAGLVTREMPASFPLNLPQNVTENMVVLLNPRTIVRKGN